ncbi:MAG: carboxynorspermidine decarboxylase [Saccharofermentanales bacterium]
MDFSLFPSPCYVVDERLVRNNLEVIDSVQKRTGCKVLLALKGFSMYSLFPLVGRYLAGITASSLNEARLGSEEMGKEVHTYAPAYIPSEFGGILELSDHIVFNSFSQWKTYRSAVEEYSGRTGRRIRCGIRVNPEYSEIAVPLYNPCYTGSRLGVTGSNFEPEELEGISGLHFHTLCEQNSDALLHTVPVVDAKFGQYIARMEWINMGGGHHITRGDYDIDGLVQAIMYFKDKYGVDVYIEPGEAIALNTGYLVTTVLDIVDNGMAIAILDTSAACHMPDVIEMPYRPEVIGAGKPGEKAFTYRLGGMTCLAGDVIDDYSFDRPLVPGDKVVFCDMAHYTMVKNNTFNGVNLPSIALYRETGEAQVIRRFGYEDYKGRL